MNGKLKVSLRSASALSACAAPPLSRLSDGAISRGSSAVEHRPQAAAILAWCSAALLTAATLAGCSQTDTVSRQVQIGTTTGVLTTADLRTITERPLPYRNRKILCTEPPPDVAKALSTAFSATGQGTAAGGVGGSGSISDATAESLAELTGRVPGLIALRDTLFRACEGYANGMLGDDVYSLISSRYGELLVTLMLAENMQARPTTQTLNGIALGAAVANQANGASGNTGTGTGAGTGTKQVGANQQRNATMQVAAESPTPAAAARPANAGHGILLASLTPMVALNNPPTGSIAGIGAGTGTGAGGGTSTTGGTGPSAGTTGTNPGTTPGTTPPSHATATNPGTGSGTNTSQPSSDTAAMLEQMQQNYLAIGLAQPLVVACINKADLTRAAYYEGEAHQAADGANTVLTPSFCTKVLSGALNMQRLQAWVTAQAALKKAGVTAAIPAALLGP